MKKIFFIIIIFVGVILGLVIYGYAAEVFSQKKFSLTAGISDWFGTIFGGFDCAKAIARCTADTAECKRKIEEEAKKCDLRYEKSMNNCNKYKEKAETFLKKCTEKNNDCKLKAEKYKTKADQSEGAKKERYLQRYNSYLDKCKTQYSKCEASAQTKKSQYLSRAADCQAKAKNQQKTCQDKSAVQQARKIESCTTKGKSCLNKLMDRCGPLIPSI